MPRNRTARLAVLGSSVQRSSAPQFPSRNGSALTRRIVAGVLALLSLALITVYFRESSGGGLHRAQGAGATVLRPFEVAAERVARPFRDGYGYVDGLVGAKSENGRLKTQVDSLRQQLVQNATAMQENARLRALLDYQDGPTYPQQWRPIDARVLARPPSQFEQQLVVAAGSNAGVRLHSPVVTADGLVGEVTKVFARAAQVTLLTDATSAVAAADLTGGFGLVRHGQGALILDRVSKADVVAAGDTIVTSGTLAGGLPSIYPKGIPIGLVTSVGQSDTDLFKQIQVQPFVDFGSLDAVAILVPRRPVPVLP